MRKRIAVALGQADEGHQSRMVEGILKEAFRADLDVCFFSMYRKYQSSAVREQGETNIFRLMNPELFDGGILLLDTIQTPGMAGRIEAKVKARFRGPVICVDVENKSFDCIQTDGAVGIRKMVSHLIEEHGCRDIAFLAGKEWHPHSQERLQGYRDAMGSHGLTVREDRIFYGDFWYTSGNSCAEQLLKDREHLPQAVVCANDCMAIGLCEEFEKHDIHVPRDILVTGFDATEEGRTSPAPLSSVMIPSEQQGVRAVQYLLQAMEGNKADASKVVPELFIGGSCGCTCHARAGAGQRMQWRTELSSDGFFSPNNEMPEDLMMQSGFSDFLHTVYYYIYQLQPLESFDLCLNDQWLMPGGLTDSRLFQSGYSESMLHALHYEKDASDGQVSLKDTFRTEQILPELHEEADHPRAWFFTPVFFEVGCFGYAAVSYGNVPRCYNDTYRAWMGCVSRGLEGIRRIETVRFQKQASGVEGLLEESQKETRMKELTAEELLDLTEVERLLDENLFQYFFQPIVYTKNGDIYAYEALMRAKTEKQISPLQIIRYAGILGRLDDVERLTFLNVLNYLNEHPEQFEGKRLFINSIPGTTLTGEAKTRVDEELKRHAATAVVELTEEAELDDRSLEAMKVRYKELGILTAVDDYGTGYSNIANLLRYMPQYVKIDRSLLSGIQDNPQKQHFVREIIEFSHENGIMALAEGVETTEELRTVIHLGVDLIQGYYTARPNPEVVGAIAEKPRSEIQRYQRERQDGSEHRVFIAGRTGRVLLSNLEKDHFTTVLVEGGEKIYRDVVLAGTPGSKTGIHLEVRGGYHGRITLENVVFSNIKNRPCIDIGADSDVVLVLVGENKLQGGGICVPEGGSLRLEGDGNLDIDVNAADYYGIGNGWTQKHGRLEFYQDGTVSIRGNGMHGIGIGSGQGGEICIYRGKYVLDMGGDMAVGIGAAEAAVDLKVLTCDLNCDMQVSRGVFMGSLEKDAKIHIEHTSANCVMGGTDQAAFGTLNGSKAEVGFAAVNIRSDIMADRCSASGALQGSTHFQVDSGMLRIVGNGREALAFGGYSEETKLRFSNTDVRVRLKNGDGRETYAKAEDFRMINGRQSIEINGKRVARAIVEEGY